MFEARQGLKLVRLITGIMPKTLGCREILAMDMQERINSSMVETQRGSDPNNAKRKATGLK